VKLGILGGSFNPVHLGHLFLADKVQSALNLDRIIFVPAYCSPFKLNIEGMDSNTGDRVDMLSCAISGDMRFAIDNCEIKREGVSYTVDTIEDIISRYLPDGKPVFIIGDDLAVDFLKWRDSERILLLADIAVVRRMNTAPVSYPFSHIQLDNEVMDISSQKVRQKIKEGSDWRSLVPSGVRAIIEDRQLYGYTAQWEYNKEYSKVIIQRVEAMARDTLNTDRFLHSRSTALLAADMCRRFGLNPSAGYLAGIAHDLAKQLDGKQVLKIVKSDKDKHSISDLENEKPNLLHGKAAAVLLREHFSIHNKDILEAVAFHTMGSAYMGPLAKVVYIADKTENSRNIDPVLRRMCSAASNEADLDNILYAVLEKTIVKLKAKELDLSMDTLLLLEKIKEKKN